MEKIRLTLVTGQDLVIENTSNNLFDDIMQFSDLNHIIHARNNLRIPIRSILMYEVMEQTNGK